VSYKKVEKARSLESWQSKPAARRGAGGILRKKRYNSLEKHKKNQKNLTLGHKVEGLIKPRGKKATKKKVRGLWGARGRVVPATPHTTKKKKKQRKKPHTSLRAMVIRPTAREAHPAFEDSWA